MLDAFNRISAQNLGLTVVIGFSAFFFLWALYGYLTGFTRFFQRFWGVPEKLEVGGLDSSNGLIRFSSDKVNSSRFNNCESFLWVVAADIAKRSVNMPSQYENGRRVAGGMETFEVWENIEQFCYRLHPGQWQPGQPLRGSVKVPLRSLRPEARRADVVNQLALICRHPFFGETTIKADLYSAGVLEADTPTVVLEEIESIPYCRASSSPFLRLSTISLIALMAMVAAGLFLGLHLWIQTSLIARENHWAGAYAMIAAGRDAELIEWVRNEPVTSSLALRIEKKIFAQVDDERTGFRNFVNQRQGNFAKSEPGLDLFWMPPIQWLARAEFFLKQGRYVAAAEQLEAVLKRTENHYFSIPFVLRLFKQLEDRGLLSEARDMGRIILGHLSRGIWTAGNCPPLKPLYEKLGAWFPEDPGLIEK